MITAIILAAGKSTRLNQKIPKQFFRINGNMILHFSVKKFEKNVDAIIIVVPSRWKEKIQNEYPHHNVIIGGESRKESSYNGLIACNKKTSKVLIHDAARPFINNQLIINCINKLNDFDAVSTVIKPNDTIVTMNDNIIENVLLRKHCRLEQTPQAFIYDVILKAHQKIKDNTTDDISVAHKAGIKCSTVEGFYNNFKITTEIDLNFAKLILKNTQQI